MGKGCLGLLRLPCKHTFHASCANRWMARELSCPMCREPIGRLAKCTRICPRCPPINSGASAVAEAEDEVVTLPPGPHLRITLSDVQAELEALTGFASFSARGCLSPFSCKCSGLQFHSTC